MCQRSRNAFLINKETHQVLPAHCKAYHCKECGPIKATKLRKVLTDYLRTWKMIGFWTFTIKQHKDFDIKKHHNYMRECWRRFITYVRRDKSLDKKTREMKYIKVVEEHKNGYIHYHMAVDCWFDVKVANRILQAIVETVTGMLGKNSNIFMKSIPDPKRVAHYITKYVVKMSLKLAIKLRRYSKSNGITLFPAKITSKDWIYASWKGQTIADAIWDWDCRSDILVYNQRNFTDEGNNLISSIINSQFVEELVSDLPNKHKSAWEFIYDDLYEPYSQPNELGDLCLR